MNKKLKQKQTKPRPTRFFVHRKQLVHELHKMVSVFALTCMLVTQVFQPGLLAVALGRQDGDLQTATFRPGGVLEITDGDGVIGLGWANDEKSLETDLPEDADLQDFSESNSAILDFGNTGASGNSGTESGTVESIPEHQSGTSALPATKEKTETENAFVEEKGVAEPATEPQQSEKPVTVTNDLPVEHDVAAYADEVEPANLPAAENGEQVQPLLSEAEEPVQANEIVPVTQQDGRDAENGSGDENDGAAGAVASEDVPSVSGERDAREEVDVPEEMPGAAEATQVPYLEFSGFASATATPGNGEVKNMQLAVSLAAVSSAGAKLIFEYAIATSTWSSLGELDLTNGFSNKLNGGYLLVPLQLSLYEQLADLRVRVRYETGLALGAPVSIDGVSVEARYAPLAVEDEEDALLTVNGEPETFGRISYATNVAELSLPGTLEDPIYFSQKLPNPVPLFMKLAGVSTTSEASRLGDEVTYTDALKHVDIKYVIGKGGLKEYLTLKQRGHQATFRYALNMDAFDFEQLSPNRIGLYRKGHKGESLHKLYEISAPVMTDAEGKESVSLRLALKKNTLTLTPDAEWLAQAAYPVVVDPAVEIVVLNVESHPVAGDIWKIDFTTLGESELSVVPADQVTRDEMAFEKLTCGSEDRTGAAEAYEGGARVAAWSCDDVASVSFRVQKTGNHFMRFTFGGAEAEAHNAALKWDGGGANANWSTPQNWNTDSVPGSADSVTFDNTCVSNCSPTIDADVTIGSFVIDASYGGTFTQSAGSDITVNGDFTQGNGIFNGGAATTTVAGNLTIATGIFNAPAALNIMRNFTVSGGAFNHNNGSITFYDTTSYHNSTISCGGHALNKVVINKQYWWSDVSVAAGCTVPLGADPVSRFGMYGVYTNNGTITVSGGTWTVYGSTNLTNNGTITHNGNGWVSQPGLVNGGSGVVTYAGTAATFMNNLDIRQGTFPTGLTVTFTTLNGNDHTTVQCAGSPFGKVIINKWADWATFTAGAGCTLPLGDNPTSTFSFGTNATNNGTITIDSGTWTVSGRNTFINNGTLTHNGNGWATAGGFVNGASGVVTYSGSSASFGELLDIRQGTFPTGLTVTFTGDKVGGVNCNGSPFAKVILNKWGSWGDFTVSANCTVPLGASPTSVFSWQSAVTNNGTITIDSGTWTMNTAHTFTNNGSIIHTGNGWVSEGSFINGTSGTVSYSGPASFKYQLNVSQGSFPNGIDVTLRQNNCWQAVSLNAGSVSLGSLTLDVTCWSDFSFQSGVTVSGNLSVVAGAVTNPASPLTVRVDGNYSQAAAAAFGGANLTLELGGSATTTFNQTAGTFASALRVNKSGGGVQLLTAFQTGAPVRVSGGTLDANGQTATHAALVTVDGGTYRAGSNTQVFGGGLTVSSGTFVGGSGTVDINGNLTVSGGTVSSSGAMNVSGNISNAGGTLQASSGTVILDGTNQSISGSNTFYNLTKSVASAATLTFAAGDTQTVTGTLTLQGAAGQRLSLRSSSPGTQWRLDPQGSRTISYLDVQDSNNVNAIAINAIGSGMTDSANNTGWYFNSASLTQDTYRFYENNGQLQPTVALAIQGSGASVIGTSSPVRLRMSVRVDTNPLPAGVEQFRLQVARNMGGVWTDVGFREQWYHPSWQYRKKITFNNSASGENLVNFPVLVALDSTRIDYSKTKDLGEDIRFVDADGTLLAHEIESWNEGGTSLVWVKVPEIEAASTTDHVWMYYHNPAAADGQQAVSVWSSGYAGVWHLKNGTVLTATDSTGNHPTSNSGATAQAGKIDGGAGVNNSYIRATDSSLLRPANTLTLSAWVKPNSVTAWSKIIGKDYRANGTWNAPYVTYELSASSNLSGQPFFGVIIGGVWYGATSNTSMANGQWYHVTGVYNGSAASVYVNGNTSVATSPATGNIDYQAAISDVTFGSRSPYSPGDYFNGTVDEVRISNVARTASWINAEYLTMADSMNSFGAEEFGTEGALVSFSDNPSLSASAPIGALLLSTSQIQGSYQEQSPSALNPAATAGQSIEYDWLLSIAGATLDTTYYFRMVKSDGTAFDAYSSYPELTILGLPPTITVSGTTNVTSGTVRIAINGTLQAQTGTILGGSWTVADVATPNTSDVITVFIDGAADADESTAVTKYDGSGNVDGMALVRHALTLGSNDNPSLTVANLSLYDYDNDEDVMHAANSGAFTADGGNSYGDETLQVAGSSSLSLSGSESLATVNLTLTGNLTSSSNGALTVNGVWTQSGNFVGGPGTVTMGGNFTRSGGSYAAASTTVFNGNPWQMYAVAATTTFHHLIINKSDYSSVQIDTNDALAVDGTLTLTNGSFYGGSGVIVANGNVIQEAGFDIADQRNVPKLDFGNDSVAQTYTVNGGGGPFNIRFDSAADASDQITFNADGFLNGIEFTGGFSGTFAFTNPSNYGITLGNGGYTQAAGTFNGGPYTLTLVSNHSAGYANFVTTGGTFNAPTTTRFMGSVQTFNPAGSAVFYNVVVQKDDYAVLQFGANDTMVVNGALTLTDGSFYAANNNGTIIVNGNVTQAATFDVADQRNVPTLDFGNDSAAQTYTVNGGSVSAKIRLDSAADANDQVVINATTLITGLELAAGFSGTFSFTNPSNYGITLGNGGYTQAAGTFQGGAYTLTLSSNHSAGYGHFITTGGTWIAPTTTRFVGSTQYFDPATSASFGNVVIQKDNWAELQFGANDTMVVNGTLTLADGYPRFGTFDARGNVVVQAGLDSVSTALIFSGGADQSFDLSGATSQWNSDVTVNKSGGEVDLLSALVMDAANQDLTVTGGTLDLNGNNLTVNGTSGTMRVLGGTLKLQGGETVTANGGYPTLATSSTVEYTGTAGPYSVKPYSYGNLVFTGSGIFTAPPGTTTVGGNFSNTGGGTFVHNSGTVQLIGTNQSITGTTTFFNLTKTVSAADTLTLGAGQTITIAGALTFSGASGQLLSLRSSSPGTQWRLDPQGSRTTSYLDVQDSNNVNASVISVAGLNIADSGNNTNWGFNYAPALPGSLGPSTLTDGSWTNDPTPTLTFNLTDPNLSDQVRYHIQIDNDADFSSPAADYTSPLQSQGAASFTPLLSLANGQYYWRVRASDGTATSSFETANGGAMAFRVDAEAPVPGSVTVTEVSTTSVSLAVAGASDAFSGLATDPYVFVNNTSGQMSAATSSAGYLFSSLAPNTTYEFLLNVADAAGNTATTATATAVTLAAVPVNLRLLALSGTEIVAVWDTGGNPTGTEYLIENVTTTASSTWITATTTVMGGMTCNTPYQLRVKARNSSGIETAFVDPVSVSTVACAPTGGGGGGGGGVPPVGSGSGGEAAQPPVVTVPVPDTTTPQVPEPPGSPTQPELPTLPEPPVTERPSVPEPPGTGSEPDVETGSASGTTQPGNGTAGSSGGETGGDSAAGSGGGYPQSPVSGEGQVQEVPGSVKAVMQYSAQGLKMVSASVTDGVKSVTVAARGFASEEHAKAETAAGVATVALAPAAVAVQYSVATAGAGFGLTSLADLWFSALRFLNSILSYAGLRRKRRYWGTVYDSVTKQPLDPAIVELVDPKTGKVVEQNITDMYGRFGFFDHPGTFVISAKKTNYEFPSKQVLSDRDGYFTQLYHGEELTIAEGGQLISPNIPMDPLAFDWNQEDKKRLVKFHPRLEFATMVFLMLVFYGGFALSGMVFLLETNWTNGLFFFLYILLVVMRKLLPGEKPWGRVVFGDRGVEGLYLELCPEPMPDIVIGRAATKSAGKFFMRAMKGQYLLKIKDGKGATAKVLLEQKVAVGDNGSVNGTFEVPGL